MGAVIVLVALAIRLAVAAVVAVVRVVFLGLRLLALGVVYAVTYAIVLARRGVAALALRARV